MGHSLLMCMATLLFVIPTTTAPPASCQSLSCTQDEVCTQINEVYGCGCFVQTGRNTSGIYDAYETCSGSAGSLSLSRCQLFEAGYAADSLHLNDPNCKGRLQDGRLVFSFDSNANMCGTNLTTNSTHIIYINSVGTTGEKGVVSHVGVLNIAFSCVYPITQIISMPMAIEAFGGSINGEVSVEDYYQITMMAYPNSTFLEPYSGNVTLELNQQVYIAVQVEQFNSKQIALVLDHCWATPNRQFDSKIYWNLIVNQCPNPEDGTVEVLQNGVSTSSHFSFRVFTFADLPHNHIYLHCVVHLCLIESGNCMLAYNGTFQTPFC
ncbi:pancreatic secretory granule membrane major glycoprotein GP2-like isoform 2-T2 [Clarias gariepinus]|uniref:pancreatic secretory granule membrane major glycoprotein GP2-like isoform X2 n=1 Tax=Clarias gariepinus TaxID=13013 RepID=UPI00234D1A0E|nr:pancreatic secretory granule membrane major glycoprotein GP2-like isoform X2 [Clarias gariepinus]